MVVTLVRVGDQRWLKIGETPEAERPSTRQLEAIREYAKALGYASLRGFHMKLKQWGWDYYDVLEEVSP